MTPSNAANFCRHCDGIRWIGKKSIPRQRLRRQLSPASSSNSVIDAALSPCQPLACRPDRFLRSFEGISKMKLPPGLTSRAASRRMALKAVASRCIRRWKHMAASKLLDGRPVAAASAWINFRPDHLLLACSSMPGEMSTPVIAKSRSRPVPHASSTVDSADRFTSHKPSISRSIRFTYLP